MGEVPVCQLATMAVLCACVHLRNAIDSSFVWMWGTKWILFYNEIVYLHIKMTLKDYSSEDAMDFIFDHKFEVST